MTSTSPKLEFIQALLSRAVLHVTRYSHRVRAVFCFLVVLVLLEILVTSSRSTPTTKVLKVTGESEPPIYNQRLYIAAPHFNDENLLRKHWIPALLDLVSHWDPEDVYVSIVESGSWDGTKDALRGLDQELEKLGIERSIQLSNTTHEDEVNRKPEPNEPGWIQTPRNKLELRRIHYLARERNKAMVKLKDLSLRAQDPREFDKILWLNDVIFNTDQVTHLINTRNGNYAAACSIDFLDPPQSPIFYDTFAIRDIDGHAALTQHWPWFSASKSRNAVLSYGPVPVQSCWNGMVVFDAAPFYNDPPLRFRAIPDTLADLHLEGSECCLIHADNPLVTEKGVWLNPNVRVTYKEEANVVVNPDKGGWPTKSGKILGIWGNRWVWWTGWPWRLYAERKVSKRLREWKDGERKEGESRRQEPGKMCLVDEMQILLSNGWMHV